MVFLAVCSVRAAQSDDGWSEFICGLEKMTDARTYVCQVAPSIATV